MRGFMRAMGGYPVSVVCWFKVGVVFWVIDEGFAAGWVHGGWAVLRRSLNAPSSVVLFKSSLQEFEKC